MPLEKGFVSLAHVHGVGKSKGRQETLKLCLRDCFLLFFPLTQVSLEEGALFRPPSSFQSTTLDLLRLLGYSQKVAFFSLHISGEALTHLERRYLYCSQTPHKASHCKDRVVFDVHCMEGEIRN